MEQLKNADIGSYIELTLETKYIYDRLDEISQKEVTGRRAVSDLEYRAKKEKPVEKQLFVKGKDSFDPVYLEYHKSKDEFRVRDGYTRITVFLRNNIESIDAVVDILK